MCFRDIKIWNFEIKMLCNLYSSFINKMYKSLFQFSLLSYLLRGLFQITRTFWSLINVAYSGDQLLNWDTGSQLAENGKETAKIRHLLTIKISQWLNDWEQSYRPLNTSSQKWKVRSWKTFQELIGLWGSIRFTLRFQQFLKKKLLFCL